MNKNDFFKILCSSTPEELNAFISAKGTKKMVNAITFMTDNSNSTNNDILLSKGGENYENGTAN